MIIKYFAWIRLKELQTMEQYEKDMEASIFEIHEENKRIRENEREKKERARIIKEQKCIFNRS